MEAQGVDDLLPPREAAVASLDSAGQYLTQLRVSLERTSGLFRAGNLGEANDLYAEVLDALHVLVFALTAAGRVIGESGAALSEVEGEAADA